tara:strand:+ start:46 stop:312 length:267 start_codon:yes stop_codon:yes gene_type:complete
MKNKKRNPLEVLGEMRRAKMGIAVGSQLEGGSIVFGKDPKDRIKNLKTRYGKAVDEGRKRKADRLYRKIEKLEEREIEKDYNKKNNVK